MEERKKKRKRGNLNATPPNLTTVELWNAEEPKCLIKDNVNLT